MAGGDIRHHRMKKSLLHFDRYPPVDDYFGGYKFHSYSHGPYEKPPI